MKDPRFLRALGILLALLLLFALPALSLADAGNFAGDSDWGGGGSDWGGSSDWGSSSWSSGDDYSGDGEGIGVFGIVLAIIILVVIFSKGGKGMNKAASRAPVAPTASSSLKPVSSLLETDPEFSQSKMVERISNLYVKLQAAWQDKKWEPMRAHMTDELYNQYARQLEPYIRDGQTNRVERIAVLGVTLSGVSEDEVNEKLVARVKSRIVDYVVDDKTGAVIRGSSTRELFMEYEWTLIRAKGAKTTHSENPASVHCASCGAPLEISYSAKCEYCGTVTVNSQYDWVISSIKGISQRSGN